MSVILFAISESMACCGNPCTTAGIYRSSGSEPLCVCFCLAHRAGAVDLPFPILPEIRIPFQMVDLPGNSLLAFCLLMITPAAVFNIFMNQACSFLPNTGLKKEGGIKPYASLHEQILRIKYHCSSLFSFRPETELGSNFIMFILLAVEYALSLSQPANGLLGLLNFRIPIS